VDYILIKAQGLPEITVDPEICRVVVAGCETLTIARNAGGNVLITWQGNCVLQSAPSVTGPFADVPGASGGSYAVPLTEPARFYRLRRP
jgi:hypothetical protein